MPRTALLQNFVDALSESFQTSTESVAVCKVADKIFTAAEVPTTSSSPPPVRLPVCRNLGLALENARSHGGSVARLANALAGIEPRLHWERRPPGSSDDEGFGDHHANAVVIGPGGLETRTDIHIGLSLLAPATRYPDHRHPPEEIYSVLSPGEWRQNQSPWHEPGIGGVVHNAPDVLHAMRAACAPLLAVWCLWFDQGA